MNCQEDHLLVIDNTYTTDEKRRIATLCGASMQRHGPFQSYFNSLKVSIMTGDQSNHVGFLASFASIPGIKNDKDILMMK